MDLLVSLLDRHMFFGGKVKKCHIKNQQLSSEKKSYIVFPRSEGNKFKITSTFY